MSDTIPIPLPALNRLWKVRFADSIQTPKTAGTVLIRGASTVFEAVTKSKKTLGWKAFSEQFPNAEVVGCEYAGEVEA